MWLRLLTRFKTYKRHVKMALDDDKEFEWPIAVDKVLVKRYLFVLLSIAISIASYFAIGLWSILFFFVFYFVGGVILSQMEII